MTRFLMTRIASTEARKIVFFQIRLLGNTACLEVRSDIAIVLLEYMELGHTASPVLDIYVHGALKNFMKYFVGGAKNPWIRRIA